MGTPRRRALGELARAIPWTDESTEKVIPIRRGQARATRRAFVRPPAVAHNGWNRTTVEEARRVNYRAKPKGTA